MFKCLAGTSRVSLASKQYTYLFPPALPLAINNENQLLHTRRMEGHNKEPPGHARPNPNPNPNPNPSPHPNPNMGGGAPPFFTPQFYYMWSQGNPSLVHNQMPVYPPGAWQYGQMGNHMSGFAQNFQDPFEQPNNERWAPQPEPWNGTCKRCNRHGHKYAECMLPSSNGFLTGCPRCEINAHDYDDCKKAKEESDDWEYIYMARIGRPPLWTRTDFRNVIGSVVQRDFWAHKQELEGRQPQVTKAIDGDEVGQNPRVAFAPWTASFAKNNSTVWEDHRYFNGVADSETKIADPAWDNPDAIEDAELFNSVAPTLRSQTTQQATTSGLQAMADLVNTALHLLADQNKRSIHLLAAQNKDHFMVISRQNHEHNTAILRQCEAMTKQTTLPSLPTSWRSRPGLSMASSGLWVVMDSNLMLVMGRTLSMTPIIQIRRLEESGRSGAWHET